MPAEKPLTADDIKPGVRVRGPGGNVFRIVRVVSGTVAMALEDASPEWERGAAQMIEPLFSGVPRYTVVEPLPDALPTTRADFLARLAAMTQAYEHANEGVILGVTVELDEKDAVTWDGQTFTACDPIHALIEDATDTRVEARDARIADLEREKAALETGCAATVAYALKLDAENERLKAEPAARTRDAALDRLVRQDKDIEELRKIIARQTATIATVSEEKRAVEGQVAALTKSGEEREDLIRRLRAVADDRLARTDAAEKALIGALANGESDMDRRALRLRIVHQRRQLRAYHSEHMHLWRARVRERAEAQRDALAAGLREACNLVQRWSADPENPVSSWRPLSVREALTRLRTLAESFHSSAQAPVTTGESGPGIVSPVATEIPVATVKEPARWQCGECEKYVESAVFCPCPHCGAFAESETTAKEPAP